MVCVERRSLTAVLKQRDNTNRDKDIKRGFVFRIRFMAISSEKDAEKIPFQLKSLLFS